MSMSKKRILLLVSNDLSYDQRMQRIATFLQQKYEVCLLGRKKKTSTNFHTESFGFHRLELSAQRGPLFYWQLNASMKSWALKQKWDAVVANDIDTILAGRQIASKQNIPLILDSHEFFTEVPELHDKSLKKWIWTKIARWGMKKVSAAYTVSESLASVLHDKYGREFAVVRNMPFRAKDTVSSIKQEKFTIIYQGAVNLGRGVELMLEALVPLTDVQFWIVGDGDLQAEMKTLAKKLGIESRVKFWGYRSPSELKKITPQAHLGLNILNESSGNYAYSLANKFFDYAQAVVPSINSDLIEYRQMLMEFSTGVICEQYSVESLIETIKEIRKDHEAYRQMLSAAKIASKAWTWENESERLLGFYDSVFK